MKFRHVENFRRQWNLNHITVTKILKRQTNARNEEIDFKREKFAVLVEYLEQQTDRRRYKRNIRKLRTGPSWRNNPNLFTVCYYNVR